VLRGPRAVAALLAVSVSGLLPACGGDRDEGRTVQPERAPDSLAAADRDTAPAGVTPVADSGPFVGRSRLAGSDFLDVSYRLLGTEPFWSVEMTRDGLVYTRLGADSIRFPFGELRRRPRNDEMRTSVGGHEIMARVSRGRCSDGMSDRVYRFTARVVIDGEQLDGCAFETPLTEPPAPESAIQRAGLEDAVEAARRTRAGKAGYRRVAGQMPPVSRSDGYTTHTRFAAYFASDALRLIEARTLEGDRTASEVSYFFEPLPSDDRGDATLRLIDADIRSADGVHTWTVVWLARDGMPVGSMYEIDGQPATVPATTVEALRAVGASLGDAAYDLIRIRKDTVAP
jgi:uncharacterized membrane protein